MQFEVGSITEGNITGIKNFGAFVELQNGKTGLVHISEISHSFVKEVKDYLKEGDKVKVKVINVSPEGRVELSIKQVPTSTPAAETVKKNNFIRREEPKARSAASVENRFEDMISKFKKLSDEKLANFKKKVESRRCRNGHKGGGAN